MQKEDRFLIHKWLKQDFIAKWIHGQGLLNSIEKSFKSLNCFKYLIAYYNKKPFSFLIVTDIQENGIFYGEYLNKHSNAINLDVFIYLKEYLGKWIDLI